MTDGADWPVRKAALAALERRHGFAARDGVRVAQRPSGNGVVGVYKVARSKRGGATNNTSYETALLSVEPLRMSCGCADFVRSSLGLCKHALVVLQGLERSGALARAARPHPRRNGSRRTRLTWSAAHPLLGSADRLARIELIPGTRPAAIEGLKHNRPEPGALRDPSPCASPSCASTRSPPT
jgi:hypothetical protein